MTMPSSAFSKVKCCISNSHLNSCWPKKQCYTYVPCFLLWLHFWKEARSATNWTLNWTGSKSCSHSKSQNSLVFTCLVIGSLLFNSSIINSAFSTFKSNSFSKVNESSKNPPVLMSCSALPETCSPSFPCRHAFLTTEPHHVSSKEHWILYVQYALL